MSVQRFKSLLFKSTVIQEEIEQEQQRRWPDWVRLLKLKKLRLAIKDHISKLITKERSLGKQLAFVKIRNAKKRLSQI